VFSGDVAIVAHDKLTQCGNWMNTAHSEICKKNAKPYRSTNDINGQAEAVRLHVKVGLAVSEISILIGIKKTTVLRWLRRAGVYGGRLKRGGFRGGDPIRKARLADVVVLWKNDGSGLKSNNRCVIHHLRRAFSDDWRNADQWDDNFHWRNHKARLLYESSQYTKAKRRLKPNFGGITALWKTIEFKQSVAWRGEWKGMEPWDETKHWDRHPDKKRYFINRCRRKMLKNNPHTKIGMSFRRRVREALIAQRAGKFRSSSEMLGCTWQHLVTHLESQFKPRMTWENYGPYWHIDHKIPCAAFDLTKESEQRKCFHWTNLQPLTAVENFHKSDLLELVRARDL